MLMQKCRWDFIFHLAFNALLNYVSLALRPRHYDDFFGLPYRWDSHCYCALWDFLNASECSCGILTSQPMQINESCNAVDRWGRFIESNVTSAANPKNLQINTSVLFYFIFVLLAKCSYFISLYFSVGNVDIFSWDVDVVKEVEIHVMVVRLGVVLFDWVILIQIESYHVFEG